MQKGKLIASYVVDRTLLQDFGSLEALVAFEKGRRPGASVRSYRRSVSADGAILPVTVVVIREKVSS